MPPATSNPLALVVLSLLIERPMHPYEMAYLLRQRHKHDHIRLNYGSLYSVVEGLVRTGDIVAFETVRDSGRPERTVYAITDAGRQRCSAWLRSLLADPVKEYPLFEAGLSLLPALGHAEAVDCLRQRVAHLERLVGELRFALDALGDASMPGGPVPRLFSIEAEHEIMRLDADRGWTQRLIDDLTSGSLTWIDADTPWPAAVAPVQQPPT